jgi:hypothetical protein
VTNPDPLAAGIAIAPGSFTSNFVNGSSGITVPKPSGIVNGDRIVAFYCSQGSADTSDITPPVGWTRIGIPWATNTNIRSSGWFASPAILDDAAEPANYAFTRTGTGTRQNICAFIVVNWDGNVGAWTTVQNFILNGLPVPVNGALADAPSGLLLAGFFGQFSAGATASTSPALDGGTSLVGNVHNPDALISSARTASSVWQKFVTATGATGNFNGTFAGNPAQGTGHIVILRNAAVIPPRNTISSWRAASTFAACAHRGAPGNLTRAEFSWDTYDNAVTTAGFTALELSAHRSSDGVWVLSHDATTGAQYTTNVTIASTPWATLQTLTRKYGVTTEPMRRLDETLDRYANYVLFVENKTYANQPEFFTILNSKDPGRDHIVLKASGDTSSLFDLAHTTYGYTTWGYFFGTAGAATLPTYYDADMSYVGLSGGNSPNNPTDQSWWDWCRTRNIPIMGHIVYTQADWDLMQAQGASMGMVNTSLVLPLSGTPLPPVGGGKSSNWYWYND